jgi:hypothetical protein
MEILGTVACEDDVDPPTSAQTMAAQRAAITEWRQPRGERFPELKAIKQPTLVVNGHRDIMVPTNVGHLLTVRRLRVPNGQGRETVQERFGRWRVDIGIL